ncbi:UV radiation resistance protein/autophagy-related protein 14 [Multifurca ochricompacta]|uniref:Autophagy-related protein 14 n=1 Tax=Multifurca ochricompacta TaxID=376703 RepID=A0AAD4M6E2_9AGAM|nr:UV radiation resistance protein/autophagy-related protein 14 [Multifurca ochricompacta]
MECHNCESRQRQFYCHNCIRAHLRDFRLQIQHVAADRDEQVRKAIAAIDAISESRIRRAEISSSQERLDELNEGLAKLRRENDKSDQTTSSSLTRKLATRRRTVSQAKLLPPAPLDPMITREAAQLNTRSETIARARSGLVSELMEVFNIVEVGGRPPIGGKAGTKGEWTIGDLVLPVPGDIRRYPPDHINAVITHTLHFIGLLTFYLGIRLPFEITWTGGKLGVGQPWIRSIKGTESGSWAKWTSKHCLHVSASSPAPVADAPAPLVQSTSDSYIETRQPPNPSSSFTTAYAMLLYNVCYLAHTQAVEVPLSQAGDVLSNLWAVCCSAELGRRSHQTYPLLPPPTPPTFPLDFAQLLQATAATPTSRPRPARPRTTGTHKNRNQIPEEDEWDLLDDADEGSPSLT